jgi:hypothetical protein
VPFEEKGIFANQMALEFLLDDLPDDERIGVAEAVAGLSPAGQAGVGLYFHQRKRADKGGRVFADISQWENVDAGDLHGLSWKVDIGESQRLADLGDEFKIARRLTGLK